MCYIQQQLCWISGRVFPAPCSNPERSRWQNPTFEMKWEAPLAKEDTINVYIE